MSVIFVVFETSFIMCINIMIQFDCFNEKIKGYGNCNFQNHMGKPRQNAVSAVTALCLCSSTLKLS